MPMAVNLATPPKKANKKAHLIAVYLLRSILEIEQRLGGAFQKQAQFILPLLRLFFPLWRWCCVQQLLEDARSGRQHSLHAKWIANNDRNYDIAKVRGKCN